MEIKLRPRQSGKTTELVELVKNDENGILVVHTMSIARLIEEMYLLPRDKILTITQIVRNHGTMRTDARLYIDEVGACLGVITGFNIVCGTHTNETTTWEDRYN